MLKFKTLTIKNFLSFGNVSQVMNFENTEIFLLLGENLDTGGISGKDGSTNGVGKSSLVNALSYALYGKPLVNIKLQNLINKTNGKNMFVSLNFEKDGSEYKIERGRTPNIFKFYVNNQELNVDGETNESQGENRLTQLELERVIGMSHDMFKNIVALNTFNEPFLSMGANDQRQIIEQLLGITKLSEKSLVLKEILKQTKDDISQEEFRHRAIKESNQRIEENIKNFERKSKVWQITHTQQIKDTQEALTKLQSLDIEQEILNHSILKEINEQITKRSFLNKEFKSVQGNLDSWNVQLSKLNLKLNSVHTKQCPECGHDLNDDVHKNLHDQYANDLIDIQKNIEKFTKQHEHLKNQLEEFDIPAKPAVFYDEITDAYNHKTRIETLSHSLNTFEQEENPFTENINSLRDEGIQKITFEKIEALVKLRDHQEFLLKLLTNKDSFIRKKIINQNISFLNSRLEYYLNKIGLPHQVVFLPDLTVEISEHGRELDFDNLSRGERTRLILSLSWSFRDVYESMNNKINLLFIDELIDNGLDLNGVESTVAILKKMTREDNRTIHLISHRDELIGRVDNVIKICKEGGFSTIVMDEEQ